jgi:hypothetical protein
MPNWPGKAPKPKASSPQRAGRADDLAVVVQVEAGMDPRVRFSRVAEGIVDGIGAVMWQRQVIRLEER